MPESYILGLLDCVGELKRMVFDKIRIGKIDEATRIFEVMENLYLHLYTFSLYDKASLLNLPLWRLEFWADPEKGLDKLE